MSTLGLGEASTHGKHVQPSQMGTRSSARLVRKVLRILWNTLTWSETGRRYPERAMTLLWNRLSSEARSTRAGRAYGTFLHRRACVRQQRKPVDSEFHTFFLRNAPQFEVFRQLLVERPHTREVRIAAIGSSSGAELYSATWVARSAQPDARIRATGVEIDPTAIEKAKAATYSRRDHELTRLPADEVERLCTADPIPLFVKDGDVLTVVEAVRRGVSWVLHDARSPELLEAIGPQDFVFANNILCHMYDREAEACFGNIAGLVAPGGYLFTYGVDLDVKSRMVRSLGLEPVSRMIKEVYLADWNALAKWPFKYWGREPMDATRSDWEIRYGSVFQRPTAQQPITAPLLRDNRSDDQWAR